jgi:surface antigen
MATVGVGDTLSGLALAWGVDLATVIGANSDQVQDPNQIWPGELLRMPGGIVPPPPPPAPPAPVIATAAPAPVVASGSAPVSHPASGPNHFTFGFCTWYVANRRYVPWFGDAGQWGPAARAMGYAEGPTPRVGAIMVDWEGPIGHVGYVETVHSDGSFVVSEMNFNAWDVVDTRTLPPGGIALETFIY